MFASVTLEGTTFGVSSNVDGYYSLSRVPAGTYTMVVSSLEYETLRDSVEVRDNKVVTKNLLLASKVVTLEGAEVRADREEQTTQVRTSVETIRPADIKRIPSFGVTTLEASSRFLVTTLLSRTSTDSRNVSYSRLDTTMV